MGETVDASESNVSYRTYGRIYSYGVIGVLILLGLAASVLLAYFDVRGPQYVTIEGAVWALAIVCSFLALGLLFVLFTLRGALRLVRQQATEVAVVRAMSHRHEFMEPRAPVPAVEYHAAAAVTESLIHRDAPLDAPTSVLPSRGVVVLEGIGPVFARRLERHGIENLRDLRASSAKTIARAADSNVANARRWKAMADLMLARSIDPQAAEILVASGIDSLETLAKQNPDSLSRRLARTNTSGKHRIVPHPITRQAVSTWVDAAGRYLEANPSGEVPSSNGTSSRTQRPTTPVA
jgi:predicted flap endonuclease-1-like 5' DNA nuclease